MIWESIFNTILTKQVPVFRCRRWKCRWRLIQQGLTQRATKTQQRRGWSVPSSWSSLSHIWACTSTWVRGKCKIKMKTNESQTSTWAGMTYLMICGLTMCLGEWRHSPSAREQRLRSPSGRWQEDPEWKRENSNKSGNTFAPEESHSGPSCLHVVSCRKPPLTSPDFQQRVSQIMFSFYGWEKRRIFGLNAISH